MKILHIISQRPEQTGSGIFVREMIRESYLKGHRNFLLCGVPEDKKPDLKNLPLEGTVFVEFESYELSFPVCGMSDVMPYKNSVFSDLDEDGITKYKDVFKKKLKLAVEEYSPDLILSHHLFLMTALARMLFPQIPLGVISHGTDIRQFKKCDLLRDFVKENCSKVDAVFALTKAHGDEISLLYNIPGERISVCGGGFNTEIFSYKKKEETSSPVVLYAGKIARAKGVFWLLKSLSNVKRDYSFHLVGGGSKEEEEICFELARKLGSKVTIHGKIDQISLSALMKKAHIFVFPSFFEGLPLVLIEALSCGTRIVTTKLMGTEELFKENSEYVSMIEIPRFKTIDSPFEEDEPYLEKILTEKIEAQIDKALKEKDVPESFVTSTTEKYTWEKVFERIEKVLLKFYTL